MTGDAPTVGLNSFARRQTKASRFSYYAGAEADLLALTAACLPHGKAGSRDGVVLVPVPVAGFFSGVVVAHDRMGLAATWGRRAEGEDPYIEITAPDAPKPAAASVVLVVYRRDLLGGRTSTDAGWEIVSINARADKGGAAGEEPPTPLSMARNQLKRPGGTDAEYTADEYAKAVQYWSRRVHAGPPDLPLEGPEYPPLTAAVLKRDHCQDWVEALCADWTFLPPAERPEPPRPITLLHRWNRLVPGPKAETGEAWAKSVLYWSRRPRRETDGVDDM